MSEDIIISIEFATSGDNHAFSAAGVVEWRRDAVRRVRWHREYREMDKELYHAGSEDGEAEAGVHV